MKWLLNKCPCIPCIYGAPLTESFRVSKHINLMKLEALEMSMVLWTHTDKKNSRHGHIRAKHNFLYNIFPDKESKKTAAASPKLSWTHHSHCIHECDKLPSPQATQVLITQTVL